MRTRGNAIPRGEVSAIIVGDIHLRDDQPVSWVKSYWDEQARAIAFVRDLQQEHRCPVIAPGDIFHRARSSLMLVSWALEHLPCAGGFHAVPGQHDLPQHSIGLLRESALYTLDRAGRMDIPTERTERHLDEAIRMVLHPYGVELTDTTRERGLRKVAVAHVLTYHRDKPFPGCEADDATRLLRRLSGFDLVVTGDNHQAFAVESEGRVLVNAGSLMRMTADQIDHRPRVYLWFAETNRIHPVYIPQAEGAISREHLDDEAEIDGRIEAFVRRLTDDVEIGLSFEKNLREFMHRSRTRKAVQDLVWEVVK